MTPNEPTINWIHSFYIPITPSIVQSVIGFENVEEIDGWTRIREYSNSTSHLLALQSLKRRVNIEIPNAWLVLAALENATHIVDRNSHSVQTGVFT